MEGVKQKKNYKNMEKMETIEKIKNYMKNENFSCESKISIIQLHYLPYIKKTIKKMYGTKEISNFVRSQRERERQRQRQRQRNKQSSHSQINVDKDEIIQLKKHIDNKFTALPFPELFREDIIYLMENYTFEKNTKQIFYILKEMVSTFYSLEDKIRHKLIQMRHNLFVITLVEYYCLQLTLFPYLDISSAKTENPHLYNSHVYSESIGAWALNRNMRGLLVYKLRFSSSGTDIIPQDKNNDTFIKYLGMVKKIAWKATSPEKRRQWLSILRKKGTADRINTKETSEIIVPKICLEYIVFNKLMKNLLVPGILEGKSGTFALSVAIYSLFNDKRPDSNILFMGVLNEDGSIGRIEFLEIKILAALRANIYNFYISIENKEDVEEFFSKNKNNLYYTSLLSKMNYKFVHNVFNVFREINS